MSAATVLLALFTAGDADADKLLKAFVEELIAVTPGQGKFPKSFVMGDEAGPAEGKPAHEVTLAKPFKMAKYEVPQNLYEAVVGTNPARWKGPRNAIEMVNHAEAGAFCGKLTKVLRDRKLIGAKEVVRLPSEAEWEYCCRAGTKTRYHFGNKEADLGEYCWFTGNAAGNDPPVGAKKPNDWGFYDMHGYCWEWCLDGWHDGYKDAPADGAARIKPDAKEFVIRGGAWTDKADMCTSAFRAGKPADFRGPHVGIRCVVAEE